ncbi:hypothetical protein [uncultured Corynebacterium sp.]|uniref:hypothetical protein n=1 Tax=uncultured Corynebacterium sp. TaxID=159447 RepID=UPI00288B4C5F|nr:hypothetical protein [uncultured Corynebacterium sp.]
MNAPQTTTSPARRASNNRPPLRHLVHHEEADGTIHLMCGLTRKPGSVTKGTHADKMNCPACDAALHLFEVMP